MRLLSARVRDYRLHRDLALEFDPRFTVITGPNQSGKSTLAEALHRALFLSAKTGGEVQKSMRGDPFHADPEVELAFEAGGELWRLRKRFAGTRGSVSLRDDRGRSLQGDEAEERLAALIGTAAVDRTTAAAKQLKERWGHLWVWQGSASGNPLALSAQAYDHDRLVERLQAGADLGVTSELDLAVLDDIQSRWNAIFTPGGAKQKPRPRAGSPLQLATAASDRAHQELAVIKARIAQQREDEQAHQRAVEVLTQLEQELPRQRQQRLALQQRLARSGELEAQIGGQQPLLDGVLKDLTVLEQDCGQLQQLGRRIEELTAAQAPALARLEQLRGQLPALDKDLEQLQTQLQAQQRSSGEAASEARAIEARLQRLRLLQEQRRIQGELAQLEQLRSEFRELKGELATLPELDAGGVERLRRLEAAVKAAEVRAETLSAGIEVIRAGQPLRIDGEPLQAGGSRLLSKPALLQVGKDVELRLLPGGGTSTAEAAEALERARQALTTALQELGLLSLEAAVQAERRRSELLAAQQRLTIQARAKGEDARLRQRLASIDQELQASPPPQDDDDPRETELADGEQLQSRIDALDAELREARARRDQAQTALQALQSQQQQASQTLETQRKAIQTLEQELREQQNQLLDARGRSEALLQRQGSQERLQQKLSELEQQRGALETALTALRAELAGLVPVTLRRDNQQLEQRIGELEQQERQATEARIRAEERLHGDGQTDLQAEREQKQAELESRLEERQRLEKEAAMLTLLKQLLEEEQNTMGSQYTAPMLSRIGRYLAHVFPQAPEVRLAYDARSGFQELQWRRSDEASFRFEELSTGAREQFAAAVRVSMAEVLAETYDGSLPVLFDDAFANSDPERQRGVHRMLEQAAGQGLQVILLSCDAERCQTINGAHQIRLGA